MTTHLVSSRPQRAEAPAPAGALAAPGPRVDYTMRRLGAVVVLLCSLLIASVVVSATFDAVRDLGGRPAAASETATASAAATTYVAAAGDTIWSIAERFRGEVELARYVDALIQANGGTAILVGQSVRLP